MAKSKKWLGRMGRHVDHLPETLITVGKDSYTGSELTKMGTANWIAIARVDAVLQRFKPKGVKELARRISVHDLRKYEGIGYTAVFVWCCILEHNRIDVNRWLDKVK